MIHAHALSAGAEQPPRRRPGQRARRLRRLSLAVLACGTLAWAPAALSQTLLSEIDIVGGVSEPVALTFEVEAAGDYTLSLVDQGFPALESGIEAFASLNGLLVDAGTNAVVGSAALGSPLTFAASGATSYALTVVGELTGGGLAALFTAEVRDAADGDVFTGFGSLLRPPDSLNSSTTLIEPITVINGGSYTLRVEDLAFPIALDALQVLLIGADGGEITRLDLTGNPGARARTVNLPPGTVELAVFATPDAQRDVGVFGIELRGGPFDDALFIRAIPVNAPGTSPIGRTAFQVPEGQGGRYALTLTDFAFPAPLASLAAIVVRDGRTVTRLEDEPLPASIEFQAAPAAYQLFTDPAPDPLAATGTFGATVARADGTQGPLVDLLETVEDAASAAVPRIAFAVPQAGNYVLDVVDFGFPASLDQLTVLLLRGDGLVLALDGPGEASFTAANDAESFTLLLSGEPQMGGGLVGVSVTDEDGGSVLVEDNIVLGTAFSSRTFDVDRARTLEVSVTDLGFPQDLAELRAAVTRGSTLVAQLAAGASVSLEATPGTYALSVVAQTQGEAFGSFATRVQSAQQTDPPPDEPDEPEQPLEGGGGGDPWLLLLGLGAAVVGRLWRQASSGGRSA